MAVNSLPKAHRKVRINIFKESKRLKLYILFLFNLRYFVFEVFLAHLIS